MEPPTEGVRLCTFFSAGQRTGPGQRGEGVPPTCPGMWVGGVIPFLKNKEGGGGGHPPPPSFNPDHPLIPAYRTVPGKPVSISQQERLYTLP